MSERNLFDEAARVMAMPIPRRKAFRYVTAGLAGAVLSFLWPQRATAQIITHRCLVSGGVLTGYCPGCCFPWPPDCYKYRSTHCPAGQKAKTPAHGFCPILGSYYVDLSTSC